VWLYIPSTMSNCAPDQECLEKESASRTMVNYEPWLTLSGKPARRPLSWRGWMTRPWIKRLSGMMLSDSQTKDSLNTFASSILSSSQAATHASHSLSPVQDLAKRMSAIYGLPLMRSLARRCQNSVFSRTCPDMFQSDLPPSSGISESEATALRRDYSARLRLAQAMSDCGCSSLESWRTPEASIADKGGPNQRDSNGAPHLTMQTAHWQTPKTPSGGNSSRVGERKGELLLKGQAENWPTPQSRDDKNPRKKMMSDGGWDRNRNLGDMTPNWPTPKSRGFKGESQRGTAAPMDALANAVNYHSLPPDQQTDDGMKSSQPSRRLNPQFVEWLMGWPVGWTRTDCALPETELSRWRRLMRSSLWWLVCADIQND